MQDYTDLKRRAEDALVKLGIEGSWAATTIRLHLEDIERLAGQLAERLDAARAVDLETRVKFVTDVTRAVELDHVSDPRKLAFKLVAWAQFHTPTNGVVTGLMDQYSSLWAARLAEMVMAEHWTE